MGEISRNAAELGRGWERMRVWMDMEVKGVGLGIGKVASFGCQFVHPPEAVAQVVNHFDRNPFARLFATMSVCIYWIVTGCANSISGPKVRPLKSRWPVHAHNL